MLELEVDDGGDNLHAELLRGRGVVNLDQADALLLQDLVEVLELGQQRPLLLHLLVVEEDGDVVVLLDEGGQQLRRDLLDVAALGLLHHPDEDVHGVPLLARVNVGNPLVEIDQAWERINAVFLRFIGVINSVKKKQKKMYQSKNVF